MYSKSSLLYANTFRNRLSATKAEEILITKDNVALRDSSDLGDDMSDNDEKKPGRELLL